MAYIDVFIAGLAGIIFLRALRHRAYKTLISAIKVFRWTVLSALAHISFTSYLILSQLALLPVIMRLLHQALFLPGNLKKYIYVR